MSIKNLVKNFSILLVLILVLGGLQENYCVYSMDELTPIETIKPALVSKISYDEIMNKAIEHSYDLQISDIDIQIAKTGIMSARSEYFPKLMFSASTEYTHNLKDYKAAIMTSVGDSFINPYTRYQSVLGITLSYNVFDFGVRRGQLNMAKQDVNIRTIAEQEALQELKLNILDLYTKILVSKRQIDLNKEILAIENKNKEITDRLFKAKQISKMEVNNQAVRIQNVQKNIDELHQVLSESLSWLSFYTGEEYDIENIQVDELKKTKINPLEFSDYTQCLIWRRYEAEVKKKELELKVTKRVNYPKINAYGRYYIYGSDYNSYPDAFKDVEPSSYTVGGTMYMPLFDGLKNHADIKRVSLELKQLYVQRDKDIAQWMTRLASLRNNYLYLDKQITDNQDIIKEINEKEKSYNRLLSKKVVSPTEYNNTKIEYLREKIELEKNTLTSISIGKGIEILTEK